MYPFPGGYASCMPVFLELFGFTVKATGRDPLMAGEGKQYSPACKGQRSAGRREAENGSGPRESRAFARSFLNAP